MKATIYNYLFILSTTLLISSCTPTTPENYERQNKEQKGQIESQKVEINRLRHENDELKQKVAVQASHQPDGMVVEEERKRLTKLKADLEMEELNLVAEKEELKQREELVLQKESQFFRETKMTLIDIGEANQIIEEFEYM